MEFMIRDVYNTSCANSVLKSLGPFRVMTSGTIVPVLSPTPLIFGKAVSYRHDLDDRGESEPSLRRLGSVAGPQGNLDAEDAAILCNFSLMGHIAAAEQAHQQAEAGAAVDWEAIIDEHILG